MNPKDLNILVSCEGGALVTGFANIAREFLQRLWDAGYKNLNELGSYCDRENPHDYEYSLSVPWKFYWTYPAGQNYKNFLDTEASRGNVEAQFGRNAFDEVVLDCEADVVFTLTDQWMIDFITRSVWRDKFKWLHEACVDSSPIPAHHIRTYKNADMLLAYTAYGKFVLEEQAKLKVFDITKCGVDLNIHKPQDKKALRDKYGLSKDATIFGTICRNQPRKLLVRYFESIAILLKKYGSQNENLLADTYFLFHTSNPDVGPNLPEHINRLGIGKHILFTYWCINCGHVKISNYCGDSLVPCTKCNTFNMKLPDSHKAATPEQLSEIYGLMDYYVQVAIGGACEMPILEAKSNGVPTIAPSCAGMADQVTNFPDYFQQRQYELGDEYVEPDPYIMEYWGDNDLGGIPIPIITVFHDELIEVTRHLFDTHKLSDILFQCINNRNTDWYNNICKQARECAIKHHDWDKTALKWMAAIDKLAETIDRNKTWNSQPDFLQVPNYSWESLTNLSNQEFLDHCLINILHDTSKIGNNEYWKLLEGLNRGRFSAKPKQVPCPFCQERIYYPGGASWHLLGQPISREMLWNSTINAIQQKNQFEQLRITKKFGSNVATNSNKGFTMVRV